MGENYPRDRPAKKKRSESATPEERVIYINKSDFEATLTSTRAAPEMVRAWRIKPEHVETVAVIQVDQ